MLGRARMVRGVQRVLMLPVMLLRAARCGVCRVRLVCDRVLMLPVVLLRAVRCMPGADGVRPGQADWKN